MIEVTRLNGKSYCINALYIELVESNPDTTITLTNGKKYIVRESQKEILQAIHTYYKSIRILSREEMVVGLDEEE
ncbi:MULTISPECIES: flagellar FlbD family protein [Bacillus]|uniref:flagellar FlbD family protein n=1 Tax=Bacillus TaxID=1386 RepID=UPI0002FBFADC|nr:MULTISPECIES: flagellar FlbD family protein [Bacillus]